MGEVYRARDTRLLRDVAIKTLLRSFAGDEDQLRRFELEARTAGALNHPNIVAVYDFGVHQSQPYLVVELLEGQTLRLIVERQALTTTKALHYAVQIAAGMSAAHERGAIHRDLKPENVFVTGDGLVKILDFGLAKINEPKVVGGVSQLPTQATAPGTVMGTVAYMSPEQARGEQTDHRSDIFSFGIVLFEMLTGKPPFRGDAAAEVISSILRDQPDYSELSRKVPPELVRVLMHCLEKKTTDRFQSTRDLIFSLRMIEANLLIHESSQSWDRPVESVGASIAVLPFRDLSPLKDHEYFCDGIAEELITGLTKIPGLRVASRTSAFQYKDRQEDIRQIGQSLNVDTILEGSVRKAGNKIRVTAELIDVFNGYHLWSEKYDRNLEDIFDIQDEIAKTIVDTLKLKLAPATEQKLVRRYTDNWDAYNLYLKGRHHWRHRTHAALNKAVELFESAIEKDPSYALAFAGLADCYSVYGFYAFVPPLEVYSKALDAAEKSLQIDPLLPEGNLSLGAVLLYFDLKWERGEQLIRRSVELDPQFGLGHCWYSGFLSLAGRYEEAAKEVKKALQIDPLSPLHNCFSGLSSYAARRYDHALQEISKALEMDPQYLLGPWYSGLCYMKKAMYEQALDHLQHATDISQRSTFFLSYLGMTHGFANQKELATAILEEMKDRSKSEYVAPLHLARVYLGLNEFDAVFKELERAYEERNVLIWLPHSPEFDPIRSDPRFAPFVAKIHR